MKKLATIVAATSLAAVGLATSAAAPAVGDQDSSPWIRFHQPDFSVSAGSGCPFQVDAHVLNDKEYFQNVEFFDDGTPKAQRFKGLLVIRFTNVDTGASVTKNVNGRALEEFRPDGSFAKITILTGHFTGSFKTGDNVAPGVYYVSGTGSSETVNPDGTKSLELGKNGSAENLCPELTG
jgi:hypothetical protein